MMYVPGKSGLQNKSNLQKVTQKQLRCGSALCTVLSRRVLSLCNSGGERCEQRLHILHGHVVRVKIHDGITILGCKILETPVTASSAVRFSASIPERNTWEANVAEHVLHRFGQGPGGGILEASDHEWSTSKRKLLEQGVERCFQQDRGKQEQTFIAGESRSLKATRGRASVWCCRCPKEFREVVAVLRARLGFGVGVGASSSKSTSSSTLTPPSNTPSIISYDL